MPGNFKVWIFRQSVRPRSPVSWIGLPLVRWELVALRLVQAIRQISWQYFMN